MSESNAIRVLIACERCGKVTLNPVYRREVTLDETYDVLVSTPEAMCPRCAEGEV